MKKIFKKFIIFILLIVLYISLAEIILSAFDPERVFVKSFDDDLLFSMYPEKKGLVVSEEYRVKVETNVFGGRQQLTEDNYSVLLLGDSFSEGWGVEEHESFPTVANSLLSPNLKIRNMGVHGSCPSLMYIHLVNYVSKFKPKQVYLQLFDNDLDDLDKLEVFMDLENGKPLPKKPFVAKFIGTYLYNLLKESSMFRLIKRAAKFMKGGSEPILYYKEGREPKVELITHQQALDKFGKLSPLGSEINKRYNGQFSFYEKPMDIVWISRLEKEIHYLNLIHQMLIEKGIKMGIIYIPAKEFFASGGILGNNKNNSVESFEASNPHYQNIKAFCDRTKISCLMGTKILWENKPEDLYFPFDAHWNREGHRIFGKIFAEYLQKSSF